MRKVLVFPVLVIVVAFILRFWNLTSLPYQPDGDEVAYGYYGWSLLHFGTDEYGKKFPTSFNSIGDYKYPGLAYLNIIPAALFGLSNLTIRFWGATLGVILVFLVYYLSQLLFDNKKISIFAAVFCALSPWAIIESRLGYENLVSSVITTAGFICLLYLTKISNRKLRIILITGSFLLLTTASFTHAAPRLFIPAFLLILALFSFFKNNPLFKTKKLILIFFACLTIIIGVSLLSPKNRGRAGEDAWHGISSIEENRLQELYVQAGTSDIKIPARLTWMFHNKFRIAVFDFIDRYSKHFSFDFLFLSGEASLQRIPDAGVLLLVEIILLPFGFLALTKNKFQYSSLIIFLWLLVAPIPSALAIGEARMNRATLMIVPLTIISGLGAAYFVDIFNGKKKFLMYILLTTGIIASSLYSLNQIFIHKPLDKPWYKQTVNQELTETIYRLREKYKAVAAGNDDYIFFLFYKKISPTDFLKRADIKPLSEAKWERVVRLDNIYFKMPFKCPKGGKLNVLYVCEGVEVPQNANVIESIYYPDGVPAYSLIEFYPVSKMPAAGNLPSLPDKFKYMVDFEQAYPDGIIPDTSSSLW